jgi:DNA-directed RNA polymerase subunit RPC12/RpoP
MTIRERIKRRASIAAVTVLAFFIGLLPLFRPSSFIGWIIAISVAVAAISVSLQALTRTFRCPRCKTRFGAAGREAVSDLPARCPNCGVDVDEPFRRD